MAEKIRGKGVISGIAMGKIMLAGQNLDGYLVSYQPEDVATEKQKAMAALTAVAEQLREFSAGSDAPRPPGLSVVK